MGKVEDEAGKPKIHIYHMRECDPKKCTALKLGKLGLARVVYRLKALPTGSILLFPSSDAMLSPSDRPIIEGRGICAIDCSWNRLRQITDTGRFEMRQLPFLLAGNPINFAIPQKLSTVEAIAAALIITGFGDTAHTVLSKFRWGETFLNLNQEPLSLYSSSASSCEVRRISEGYSEAYSPQAH